MVWYNIMSIFGRKLSHFAHKAGRKFHVKDIKKFGTKALHEGHHLAHDIAKHSKETYHDAKKIGKVALHGVDKGLVIAHKVVGGANKVIKKASSIAGKLEGVPVLGEFAGMASSGLKQLGTGVNFANKSIKGLEKGVKKVEHLGHTIDRSGKAFKSGNDDKIAGSIKDIAGGFHGKNPLKR